MSLDRIRGGLLGVAIGDALGATTEFMFPEDIADKFGWHADIVGGGWLRLAPGQVTDDTEMTIAVARGILANPDNPVKHIGKNFKQWAASMPKDIGGIIAGVLHNVKGDQWFKASENYHIETKKTAGNGSLMRVLPAALAYDNLEDAVRVAIDQSRMTHWDSLASEACAVYTKAAWLILNEDCGLAEAIHYAVEGTTYQNFKPTDVPNGYVVNTLKWALYICYTYTDFSAAVQQAVNMGYDADTLGAVVGGLYGLHTGYSALPKRYVDAIKVKNQLIALSGQLYKLRLN